MSFIFCCCLSMSIILYPPPLNITLKKKYTLIVNSFHICFCKKKKNQRVWFPNMFYTNKSFYIISYAISHSVTSEDDSVKEVSLLQDFWTTFFLIVPERQFLWGLLNCNLSRDLNCVQYNNCITLYMLSGTYIYVPDAFRLRQRNSK